MQHCVPESGFETCIVQRIVRIVLPGQLRGQVAHVNGIADERIKEICTMALGEIKKGQSVADVKVMVRSARALLFEEAKRAADIGGGKAAEAPTAGGADSDEMPQAS